MYFQIIENICKPIVICNEEHRFIVAHQMKEIDVEIQRYDNLKLKAPDLIAMDVQGAELKVLKGL